MSSPNSPMTPVRTSVAPARSSATAPVMGTMVPGIIEMMLPGPYKLAALGFESTAVITNKASYVAYRGQITQLAGTRVVAAVTSTQGQTLTLTVSMQIDLDVTGQIRLDRHRFGVRLDDSSGQPVAILQSNLVGACGRRQDTQHPCH